MKLTMSRRPLPPARHSRRVILPLLAAFVAACATTPGARRYSGPPIPVPIPDLERRLDALTLELEKHRIAEHIPGMALAIVKDDEVIYAHGFGRADMESGRPVTEGTLFAIGSTTKAFTTNLIGMLIDEGTMDWDDPITEHLPYFELATAPTKSKQVVTLRDLLCHRTGFTRMGILWGAGLTSPETVLHTATGAEAWAPFRERFLYNNVMYLAAGEAASQVAGMTWQGLVQSRLLGPLEMVSSTTSLTAVQLDPRLSIGYEWDEDGQEVERVPMRDMTSIAPAGAIFSNVTDMARWVRMQLARGTFDGNRLIDSDRIEETWTPHIKVQPGTHYGLGWMLGEWNGRRVVEHGGNIDGFTAEVAMLPDSNIGFVWLANVSTTALQQTSRAIIWEALLGTDPESSPVGDESFDDLVGTYIANFGSFDDAEFQVMVESGKLAIDVPGQTTYELLSPESDGKRPFALLPAEIQVAFVHDEDGRAVQMNMFQAGLTFEIPRAGYRHTADRPDAEFAAYLGAFRDPALGELIQIVVRNGRLACDVPGQNVFELHLPDDGHVWRFRMTESRGIEFHVDDAGEVASLTFHERGTERVCPRADLDGKTALPTTAEILELRGARRIGDHIAALGPTRMQGRIQFLQSGVEGTVEVIFSGADRFVQASCFEPFGWEKCGFDGERGWIDSSFHALNYPGGKRLAQLRLSHPMALIGDWSRTFDSILVTRAAEIDGRHHWVVQLRAGTAPPMVAYVDSQTGDIVRVEMRVLVPGAGSLRQEIQLEDYRNVDGLRVPFRVITENASNGRTVVQFSSVERVVSLSDDAFTAPR